MHTTRAARAAAGQESRCPLTIEWPTLTLILATHASIGLTLVYFDTIPWLLAPCLVVLIAFHTSLVHEVIHGHPTPSGWINDLLGSVPFALVYPYPVFKRSHLAHHRDAGLTLPGIDPESFYVSARTWQNFSGLRRILAWCNMTLLGRLAMNPLISLIRMARACCEALFRGPDEARRVWLVHLLSCTVLLYGITAWTTTPVGVYLVCAYLSHSLISLRSFFEHRAMADVDHRVVVVDSCRFLNLLYLNNNFHAVHHRYPWLPWYEVEPVYRREVNEVLARNGGFHVAGYSKWFQYLLRPIASPVHPFSD